MSETKQPTILTPEEGRLSPEQLALAAEAIAEGELVAFPTDTVYGVAANASLPAAVRRLFEAKGRPPEKALALLIADEDDVARFARDVPEAAWALARRFWPGPLTMVLWRTEAVCAEAVGGGQTVALRLPDHDLARAILREARVPVAVTSANRSGVPSTVRAAEVLAQLGPWLSVMVDEDAAASGVPSTVVDLTVTPPRVLREGGISEAAVLSEGAAL